ncbi:heme ABC exporter ATP-binding protein CcmA [Salinisphaera sp. Q1T1-3]|uniref:heme ABC exporter ATP-binding protein CcmA n=1 Tax=Salinisphaera sp. Q1T1-3 TaxID=2321229 RepID=UPI000E77000C|nr:heme ABC exporter ATP-binding protein CcmA [Salinisphaera sp. Q1T1-3]RJS92075.1 heme ABC exporter ATP-binding protein CcmA [Salinisphaera sp. Q1T1-3]
MTTADPALLQIRNLACGRGERALFRGLNLDLAAGEIVRVLGDNGVGKTTLLRTLVGLLPPLDGEIRWRSDAPGEVPFDAVCFIDYDNALSPVLNPVENLIALLRVAGQRRAAVSQRIREVLSTLGLDRLAHRPCGRLSSGQKRRISLARLWLTDAPVWLLDEPAAALDADTRAVLARRMDAHTAKGGAIVYTTHEPLDLPTTRGVSLL